MESTASNEIVAYVLVGTLIMIILVISIIVFVTLSQRKSTKQLLKMQEMENQHQKDIFNSVIATQEKERQRIAKNLHDDIGTSLSAIGLLIGQIKNISEGEVKDLSIKIRTNIDGIVDASRRVISDLSPASLLRFGFFVELDNLTTLISESANIKFFINTSLSSGRLRTELELTLYRIIKEFINNTIKYAKATEITILIELLDNTLHINIKDNGNGFDVSSADKDGHGLNNMESRIYLLNGKSELNSSIGSGTELDMKIPLTEEDIKKLNA